MSKPLRITTVHGPKGGVGTSFIANNLALGIALASKQPALLIDLDLTHGGTQASLLSLEREIGSKHLGQLISFPQINTHLLKEHVVEHPKLPLHILAAPEGDHTTLLTGEQLYEILTAASLIYDHIIIDAAQPFLNEVLGACIDCSSLVFLVVIPDIIALQTTGHFIQQAEENDYGLQKCQMIVNMSDLSTDLGMEDINHYFEESLKRSIEFSLPFEPIAVIKSINQGVPILQKGKSERLIEAFVKIVKRCLKNQTIDLTNVRISSKQLNAPSMALIESPTSPKLMPTATKTKAVALAHPTISGWTPDQYRSIKQQLHRRLQEEMRLTESHFDTAEQRQMVQHQMRDKLSDIMLTDKIDIASREDRMRLIEELIDESLGLGPLEVLLKDTEITEIMINGPYKIYIERKGKLILTPRQFLDEKQLRVVIDRIVAPIGRRIDESSPMVDARLANGDRVNIIIPPLALDGASLSIRKFPKDRLTINHYLEYGSVSPEMAEFLDGAVKARLNILICGGTGSGKTTLLNILSSFITPTHRVVTIEDSAELQLHQDHVVRLESRPANLEGKGAVTIRDLVRNALRMRPDRIVVGEVRGGEALDMLQAMNTGHDGSLTTGHANSSRDILSRLETMVLMAGVDLPIRAIREQIASAIDLIVHQSRMRDGTRKVVHVVELTGMEGDIITLQDIFKYEQLSLDSEGRVIGTHRQADIRPKSLEKFIQYGVPLPKCFDPNYSQQLEDLNPSKDKNDKEKKRSFW